MFSRKFFTSPCLDCWRFPAASSTWMGWLNASPPHWLIPRNGWDTPLWNAWPFCRSAWVPQGLPHSRKSSRRWMSERCSTQKGRWVFNFTWRHLLYVIDIFLQSFCRYFLMSSDLDCSPCPDISTKPGLDQWRWVRRVWTSYSAKQRGRCPHR